MDLILAAAKDPQKSMLAVLSETGMRVGELKCLTWEDVDFEHGVIQIRAKDGWKPKTGDERAIPMSPAARAILERLPRTGLPCSSTRSTKCSPPGLHLVRVSREGGLGRGGAGRHSIPIDRPPSLSYQG